MTTKLTTRQRDKLIEAAQNAIEFVVEGRGEFPLDMLRYDRCWPASIDDTLRIPRDHLAIDRQIGLAGLKVPTAARWASFGWKVVE